MRCLNTGLPTCSSKVMILGIFQPLKMGNFNPLLTLILGEKVNDAIKINKRQ